MAQKLNVQYIRYYTDGSAARKLAPAAAPVQTAVLPKQRKLKRRTVYVDPIPMMGILVAVCLLIMMVVGLFQLHAAKAQVASMEAYVEQLTQENEALSAEYHAGYDPEDIRRTALALDMIPADQAQCITITLPADPAEPETLTLWERIGTFLTGLFA